METILNQTVKVAETANRMKVDAPEMAPMHMTNKPKLMSVADAKALDTVSMMELFKNHINPGQLHFMKLLGFHKVKIERAEGM